LLQRKNDHQWVNIGVYLMGLDSFSHAYHQLRGGMAQALGQDSKGQRATGAAFHVGDGVYVTAAHIATLRHLRIVPASGNGVGREITVSGSDILTAGDDRVDVALLRTEAVANVDLLIGTNWDDVIRDEDLMGWPILLMGFPVIPDSISAVLVMAPGHIAAVIDRDKRKHVHYVTSALPRSGFSGSPLVVAVKDPWVMGVLTSALTPVGKPTEVGFGAAVSIEPVWHLLDKYNLAPGANAELIHAVRGAGG